MGVLLSQYSMLFHEGCKYVQVSDWSSCDNAAKTSTRTLELSFGDTKTCDNNTVESRQCDEKEERRKNRKRGRGSRKKKKMSRKERRRKNRKKRKRLRGKQRKRKKNKQDMNSGMYLQMQQNTMSCHFKRQSR